MGRPSRGEFQRGYSKQMQPRILTLVVDEVRLLHELITTPLFFPQLSCEPHRTAPEIPSGGALRLT